MFFLKLIEFNRKRGALVGLGLTHHSSSHELNVFFDDGQSQSQRRLSTCRLSAQPLKFFKDLLKILFREARPVIPHADQHFSADLFDSRFNLLPFF